MMPLPKPLLDSCITIADAGLDDLKVGNFAL